MKSENEKETKPSRSSGGSTKERSVSPHRKSAAVFFERLLIVLLFCALVVMFASYSILKSAASYTGLPLLDDSERRIIFGDGSVADQSSLGLLSPDFVGISFGTPLAPVDPAVREALLSEIRPFLLGVFSDIGTALEFSSDDARSAYFEKVLDEHGSYIYLSFSEELPAAAILPACGGGTGTGAGRAFGVKDLFIFCDPSGSLSGLCLDDGGGLALLTVREKTSLTFDSIYAYETVDGMQAFEFLPFGGRNYPVFSTSVSTANLAAYTNSGELPSDFFQKVSNVLDAFGFNPNGTRFYRTGSSSVTYVEAAGELRFSNGWNVTYSSTGSGGVHLSELCGKQKEIYSFEDKISAAYRIVTSLDRRAFGGDAQLCLRSVGYDDEKLTLRFVYSADGISVDDRPAAELVFGDSALLSATVRAQSFLKLESSYSDVPQKLLFAFAYPDFDPENPPISFFRAYTRTDGDAVYNAKYAFFYASGKEAAS